MMMVAFSTLKYSLIPFVVGSIAQIQLDSRFRHCVTRIYESFHKCMSYFIHVCVVSNMRV